MLSMVARLAGWARRSTGFSEPGTGGPADSSRPQRSEQTYRLRRWPTLPPLMRTAAVLRMLSVMSTRPVNRDWMLRHSGLGPTMVDQLIERLQRDDALDAIDSAPFGPTRAPD